MKAYNINFHDPKRTDTKIQLHEKMYDVGSSFFKDVREKKLKIADFKGHLTYYKHYGEMSWSIPRFVEDINVNPDRDKGDHRDTYIYDLGKMKLNEYSEETKFLESINLIYK